MVRVGAPSACKIGLPWHVGARRPGGLTPRACCGEQVMQSKKRLLEKLHASVAAQEDAGLKRLLGEDETMLKRREDLTKRLRCGGRTEARI
jgi:Dynamin GTPase effector domain